jgi:hypothetical protein
VPRMSVLRLDLKRSTIMLYDRNRVASFVIHPADSLAGAGEVGRTLAEHRRGCLHALKYAHSEIQILVGLFLVAGREKRLARPPDDARELGTGESAALGGTPRAFCREACPSRARPS